MDLIEPSQVRHIAIVGTGIIGSGWAAVFLSRGYRVTAYVRSAASEAKFHTYLEAAWRKLVARKLTLESDGWRSVTCVTNLAECVAHADYVQVHHRRRRRRRHFTSR